MATYYGFQEEGPLAEQRAAVLSAIQSGELQVFRAAWRRYQELAEAQIEDLPDTAAAHAKAQIGLILAKAQIWYEAGDLVRYFEEHLSAQTYAQGMGFVLSEEAREVPEAERLQASGQYDDALELYIEREQTELTDHERGLINLRMAECYWALLQQNHRDADARSLLEGSVQSALLYLDGSHEQAWALRLLEAIELAE